MTSLAVQTAGALGDETSERRGKKRKRGEKLVARPELPSNAPTKDAVPAPFSDYPTAPGFNLAGRPDAFKKSDLGVRKWEMKSQALFRRSNINEESYLHFIVKSSKNEWIRFHRQSVSVQLYGQYKQANWVDPAVDAAAHAALAAADKVEWHALRARTSRPAMFIDPDVMGTGFFSRIDVSINGVQVPTNSAVGALLLQSIRANRLYNSESKREHHINTTADHSFVAPLKEVMKRATAPFDYNDYTSGTGVLIPVFLDGIFPFDLKCSLTETVNNQKEPMLYFPPDTEVDIKLHMHQTKMEAIFHHQVTMGNYFNGNDVIHDPAKLRFTFQDAHIEYESVSLFPSQEMSVISQFDAGGTGNYEYDIVRGQHQNLTPNASYTENTFQIMPWCRMFVIMFLPDWATFPMENKKRPLSGFSRFPVNCSKIVLSLAGEDHLITKQFDRFGMAGEQHQISKKIYFEYLKSRRWLCNDFDDLFPKNARESSLIQSFLFDARSHMSAKNEQLSIQCEFAAGHESPEAIQVCCLSIHPNGAAVVSGGTKRYSWVWEFKQNV